MKATLTMYNSILAFLTPHNTRGGLIAALIGLHCSPRKSAQPPATSDGTLFVGSLGAAGIYRAKRYTSKSQ